MKFSYVSILLTGISLGGEVFASDVETEDDVLDEDENEDEAPKTRREVKVYLNKHFKDLKSSKRWKQYVEASEQGDEHKYADEWVGRKKNGDPCISQGHRFTGSLVSVDRKRRKKMAKLYGGRSEKWCCSGKTATSVKKEKVCGCIAKGEEAAGNLGLECCSNYAVEEKGTLVCGGIPPLAWTQPLVLLPNFIIPLDVNNCMYPRGGTELEPQTSPRQKEHADQYDGKFLTNLYKCGRRPCQVFGSKPTDEFPVCCSSGGAALDPGREADSQDKPCGCTPQGDSNPEELAGTRRDCCSEQYLDEDRRICACIEPNKRLPEVAKASDCCTGKTVDRYENTWCREEKCIPQGGKTQKHGQVCCARNTTGKTYDQGTTCPCLSGGTIPKDKLASRCCSQRFEKDNKTCSWVPTKGIIKTWFKEEECFSGDADEYNTCKCMPPGSKKRATDVLKQHPEECCSGNLIDDSKSAFNGLCSCIATGDPVGHGGKESFCCSGRASNGVCVCAEPSSAFKSAMGMVRQDCCSGRASEHFCRCSKKDDKNTKACCGEVVNNKCACIPDNYVLPSHELENASDVCCNTGDKCATTCGK